jgi:hypothetical protein
MLTALVGAFFNSGQSCCAIEVIHAIRCSWTKFEWTRSESMPTNRYTTHSSRNSLRLSRFVRYQVNIFRTCNSNILQKYRLGDPTETETTLGPVVSLASAERIRKQISDACQCTCAQCRPCQAHSLPVNAGAHALIPAELFPVAQRLGTLIFDASVNRA